MLRIVEQAHRTDTGRQRNANEDAYFARSPVYAVADGMGGAQAGEVASKIAADAFATATDPDESPERYLERIVRSANDRIHELAQRDSERSGMGTTLTAAVVRDDEISLAHVGDSRAYLLRNGELRRLTSDHSLVEEMRRRGQLTERQAEEHPQRSIITRALGPEADVDVDTMTVPAEPGDVVVLCSDGLTTMVTEERIAEVLKQARTLDVAVKQLIKEANSQGGRDNITVVAFRLAGAEDRAAAEDVTLVGPTAEEAGLTAETVGAAPPRARRRRPGGYAAPRRSRGRRAARVLASVAVLGVLVAGAIFGARQIYFLGTDDGGRLALYRGLPYDLPAGVSLYSEQTSAPVQVASLPATRRDSVTNHELRSHDDAVSLFDDLERSAGKPSGGGGKPSGQQNGGGKSGGGKQGGSAGGGGGSGKGGGGSGGKEPGAR